VDLTGDGFVVGSASAYAGGQTSSKGTNAMPVHGAVSADAPPTRSAAPMTSSAAAGPDRSRRPSLAGAGEWKCPFPPEADADEIDEAAVTLRVEVDPSGAAKRAAVMADPGHGFGREAQRCAMSKRWNVALDHEGNPIEGTVTVRVRFDR
jgi:protein TonB